MCLRNRRIGKTHLVWKAYEDQPILYFFVARKAESDLCSDYLLEIETKKYTRIGSWWDRKGKNEIDIVAENELEQQALFIEVKRKIENYDPELLNSKIAVFTCATGEFKNYTLTQKGVSLGDM